MAKVQLRGGPGGPPAAVVSRVQRDRIFHALAEVASERGYAAATIGMVLERARISRRTFYDLFDDKDACFLSAYREAVDSALETVREACAEQSDPAERIRQGVHALTDLAAAEPAIGRLCVTEVLAAGPPGQAARSETIDRFSELVSAQLREMRVPDATIEIQTRTLVGIVSEALYDRLSRHDTEHLGQLVDELVVAQVRPVAT